MSRKTNPFTLMFGKKPAEYISRLVQTEEIVTGFADDPPRSQLYMITGVRGSGKTVLMTEVQNQLNKKGWVTISLNPTVDMLKGLASKLYSAANVNKLFVKARIDLSFLGIGASFEGSAPVTDYETAIGEMLKEIKKQNKKVLVTVDEVTNNDFIKQFASAFQIFVREDLPVFLLMTGLYENIYDIQNEKMLTFLFRDPKIMLEPLNRTAIKASYMDVFDISEEMADEMARLTKGYSYAYQLLGYLYWDDRRDLDKIMPAFDQYLQEYVYEKIWSELSSKDKDVMAAIAEESRMKVRQAREKAGLSSSEFSVYRDRLMKKGLVNTAEYGYISLALPRMDVYIKDMINR